MPKVTIRPSAAAAAASRQAAWNSSGLRTTWSAASTSTSALRSRSAASTAETATAGPESRLMGSSTMSASTPRSRNCSATTNRKSVLVMTIGRPNNSGSQMRPSTCWKVDPSPTRGTNCFGMLSRETGQSRVPAPPHMITGMIWVGIDEIPGWSRHFKPPQRKTSSRGGHNQHLRSKPPNLDAGGLFERIECPFDVHHQPATVFEQARNQRPARFAISVVSHRKHDRVRGLRFFLQCKAIFPERRRVLGKGIVDLNGYAERLQLTDDVDNLRISDVDDIFLKCQSEHCYSRRLRAAFQKAAQALARDAYPDGIVDAPAGENHVGMIARLLRSKRQVIRVDANAVAADEARRETDEIPFGRSRRKHVAGVDVELVEDRGKLVHESDVEGALCVLDRLGRFRDFYGRCLVQAGRYDGAIHRSDDLESTCILTSHHLCNCLEPMSPITRIDPLGRIAHGEIAARRQTRDLFEDWHAIFLGCAGIDRRFVDNDVALLQSLAHGRRGAQQRRQVRSARLIDWGRYRHDEEIRSREFA